MTLTRLLTAAGFAVMLAAGSAHAQELDTDATVSVDTQGNTTTTTQGECSNPPYGTPIGLPIRRLNCCLRLRGHGWCPIERCI